MRVLLVVLLLLNLLALAGLQGWLGGAVPRGEAERLTNQLRPESIRLLATEVPRSAAPVIPAPAEPEPAAAPAPAAEAPAAAIPLACVRFAGLNDAQARELAAAARTASPQFVLADRSETVPSSWWVHVPPQGSREAAERKAGELRELGVNDLFIVQEEGANQYAISLGLFKTEASANQHLAQLRARGVRSGQIGPRGAIVHRVEIRGPADALSSFASDATSRLGNASRLACEP